MIGRVGIPSLIERNILYKTALEQSSNDMMYKICDVSSTIGLSLPRSKT